MYKPQGKYAKWNKSDSKANDLMSMYNLKIPKFIEAEEICGCLEVGGWGKYGEVVNFQF